MHANFPLFPLPLVAQPHCRLPLQIFEPRYLDLVKNCAARQQCFGVVTLDQSGAGRPGTLQSSIATAQRQPPIFPIGTAVKIVDFNQLPNGLLGIVCEGQYRFRVHDAAVNPQKLLEATIETLPQQNEFPLPTEFDELVGVVMALLAHDYARNMGYEFVAEETFWRDKPVRLSWYLSALLPVSDEFKYRWLATDDAHARLASIMETVDRMQHVD
ncbi:MAG: LON peptidase substrate-binding domain-containing protein [Pseudomonadales bacterium]